jgi:hypothetical protein
MWGIQFATGSDDVKLPKRQSSENNSLSIYWYAGVLPVVHAGTYWYRNTLHLNYTLSSFQRRRASTERLAWSLRPASFFGALSSTVIWNPASGLPYPISGFYPISGHPITRYRVIMMCPDIGVFFWPDQDDDIGTCRMWPDIGYLYRVHTRYRIIMQPVSKAYRKCCVKCKMKCSHLKSTLKML